MSRIVPMPWHAVPIGAEWIDSDGNVNMICCWRDNETRYLWTDDPHTHYWYTETPPDVIVPVVIPSDDERTGAAIVNLIKAGFTVQPIEQTGGG